MTLTDADAAAFRKTAADYGLTIFGLHWLLVAFCVPAFALSLMALVIVASGSGPVRAGTDVKVSAIEIGELPGQPSGDSAEVVIRADHRLEFTLFRLQNPTRIVIDMPGADVSQVAAPSELPETSLVKAVTTTQFRGKTGDVARVVVVMRGDVAFDAKNQGDAIVLTARRDGAEGRSETAVSGAQAAVQPSAPEATPVVEISGDEEAVPSATRFAGCSRYHSAGSSRTSSAASIAAAVPSSTARLPGSTYHSRCPRRWASSNIANVESLAIRIDPIGSITTTMSSGMAALRGGERGDGSRRPTATLATAIAFMFVSNACRA